PSRTRAPARRPRSRRRCRGTSARTCRARERRSNRGRGAILSGMRLVVVLSLTLAAVTAAAKPPKNYTIPKSTLSPDKKLGVLTPDRDHVDDEGMRNQLVEVASGKVIAKIEAYPVAERMNHISAQPRWSADSATLLWFVDGKWAPFVVVV